jgi:hypothetical protein
MKYTKAILALSFMLGLAACHPAHHGHPHGCPPGQAKKGNCWHD